MSENVQTAMFEILKSIQGDLAAHRRDFASLDARVGRLEERVGQLDVSVRKIQRDMAGILVVGKTMIGSFTEQIAEINERVAALETRPAS